MSEIGFKQCRTCHFTKPLRAFPKHRGENYPDGYENHCKACQRPRVRAREARRAKNRA